MRLNNPRQYFAPFGNLKNEVELQIDEAGKLGLLPKKVPATLHIRLEELGSKDHTRVFLIFEGKIIEGFPNPSTRSHADYAVDSYLANLGEKPPTKTSSGPDESRYIQRTLLLPGDPEFFQTAKLLIGDKVPEV